MRTFRLRNIMLVIAMAGLGLWLVRDWPAFSPLLLFLPTFWATGLFLERTGPSGRRVPMAERVAAWLLVTSVAIPVQILSLLALSLFAGLAFALVGWAAGYGFD